jgi:hypothetical protein
MSSRSGCIDDDDLAVAAAFSPRIGWRSGSLVSPQ